MTTHASLSALFPTAFARAGRVIFADAVRDHQDEVYGVALRILGDRDAAREAASAAFLKAYRSWDRYDQTRPVRYWLLRIAANEAISVGRSRTRERAERCAAITLTSTVASRVRNAGWRTETTVVGGVRTPKARFHASRKADSSPLR